MKPDASRFALAIGFAISTFASGCSSRGVPGDRMAAPRTLRLAFAEMRSLDPLYTSGAEGAAIDTLAFSYLLRARAGGTLMPDLAAEVPSLANGGLAPDGRTITYRLRRGVRWQDGAPLTSADVAFTVRAELDPRNSIGSRSPYDRIASIETPDRYTVRLRLRTADASMLGTFLTPDSNLAVLPAHLLSKLGSLDRAPYNALPIGSGPYRIVAWKRGDGIRLEANPRYFGGAPGLKAIELRSVPDPAVVLTQLRTGELDGVIGADPRYLDQLRTLADKRVTVVPYVGEEVLAFNVESAVFAEPAMRRAVAQLVDPQALARIAHIRTNSVAEEARGIFSYANDPSAPWPRFDPAAAARALDALGWRRGPAGGRARDGRELVVHFVYDTGGTANALAAVVLQQQFARAGIRVDLKTSTASTFYAPASENGTMATGRFDLALVNYSTNVDPDLTWLFACGERAPAGYNWSRYCSPDADALMRAALQAVRSADRIALLRRLQRIVAADLPLLPLMQNREIDVTPLWLDGFTPNSTLRYASAGSWSAR